jgi:hypothetical protein
MLALCACDPTDDDSTLQVSYIGHHAYRSPEQLRIEVRDGSHSRIFTQSDFSPDEQLQTMRVSGSGTLRVSVGLFAGADTLAATSVTMTMHRNWGFGVVVLVGSLRPTGPCVGDMVAMPVNDSDPTPDTMYVSHAGLPRGEIC